VGEQQHGGVGAVSVVAIAEAHARRIVEQGCADGVGKGLAGEQVAVAGHEEDRGAGVGKLADGGGDAGVEGRGEVVVAGPVFEQVTEDEEAGPSRAGPCRKARKAATLAGSSSVRWRSEMNNAGSAARAASGIVVATPPGRAGAEAACEGSRAGTIRRLRRAR
jgi:hypothetical protein